MEDETRETEESRLPPAPLPAQSRRVLGVLVEKAFCTPEYYPLSIKAVTAGCNQKNGRDPVMDMTADDVEEVLAELHQQRLVIEVSLTS